MSLAEALEAAVGAGDEEAIRNLLGGLPEEERGVLIPTARALVADVVRQGIDAMGRLRLMLLVAYGTLPASEIRKVGWRSNHVPKGLEDVLRQRSPERLGAIVDHLLNEVGGPAWPSVRALVREGVVPRPEGPSYTLAMLVATRYADLTRVIAADPGLLEVEAWRLFEVEGGGEDSLAAHEKYTGDKWGDLFRELAARDPVMRRRLLDASLSALARDFATFRAGWFSRFHETLAPSDEERAERVDGYLGLLRSRSGPTVSFAVAALSRLSRAGRLPPKPLLERIGPVLIGGSAGAAKAALELVERAAEEPDRAGDAALVAAAALAHASPDVQRGAITLIGRLVLERDEAVARALAEHTSDVAPSQRPAMEVLLTRLEGREARTVERAGSVASATSATTPEVATPYSAPPPSPLDPSRAVEPLTSMDALVDVAVSLIETGEPADDVERILEAVGRLGSERPDGFANLTSALAKRARTMLARRESSPFSGLDARADVAAVLLAWTTGEVVGPSPGHSSIDPGAGAFLSARAREVAEAAGSCMAFLSVAAPTHIRGYIDPVVLVARLAARPPASRLDLVAALLRLAPQRRTEALAAASRLVGEVGSAVRYALGGDEPVGATSALWVAAARVRAPGEDDRRVEHRHPRLGPDAGLAARIDFAERETRLAGRIVVLEVRPELPDETSLGLPTVLLYRYTSSFTWTGHSDPAMLRWMATIQPGYRESWAAVGSVPIARNVDWWSAEWANLAFLEPFTDSVTTIGPQARRLIGIALGAKETGERGLAADVARLGLADGRMTDAHLAEGLTAAAAIGCDRLNRWAVSLGDVAAASERHAHAVIRAMARTLPALSDRPPAKLVPLMRLFDELLAATGAAVDADAREPLARLSRSGGQAGRLARSILSRLDQASPAPAFDAPGSPQALG